MIPFVGLTGGIGSGKSTVSGHFAGLGVTVIDADDVGHELYDVNGKATRRIAREFGQEFIMPEGMVDRNMLRQAVFADFRLRKRLEAITHPLIRKECLTRMNAASGPYGILVAPLLFEVNFLTEVLIRVLVIDCEPNEQLSRAEKRGRFDTEQVKSAMKSQINRKERLARADDVLVNSGNIDDLADEIKALHKRYLGLHVAR